MFFSLLIYHILYEVLFSQHHPALQQLTSVQTEKATTYISIPELIMHSVAGGENQTRAKWHSVELLSRKACRFLWTTRKVQR